MVCPGPADPGPRASRCDPPAFSRGESTRSLGAILDSKYTFLDMQYVTRSAFKGIELGQAIESWCFSKEPHELSAPWATRRRGGGSVGAFVVHEPNSILEPQRRLARFQDQPGRSPARHHAHRRSKARRE